jgi:hypothetical protein
MDFSSFKSNLKEASSAAIDRVRIYLNQYKFMSHGDSKQDLFQWISSSFVTVRSEDIQSVPWCADEILLIVSPNHWPNGDRSLGPRLKRSFLHWIVA